MNTTTIRVDTDTHARLQELSRDSGTTLIETVRAAAEALGRRRFAEQVATELAGLQRDAAAWAAYLAEAEATSVPDGLG
jgi:predicted transcriptional regulator